MDKFIMEIETKNQEEQRERMLAYALRVGNVEKKTDELNEEER